MRLRKKTAKEIKDTADVDHSYPTQPAPGGDIVDPIINTAQLADYINWQPNRILRLVRKGKVPAFSVARTATGNTLTLSGKKLRTGPMSGGFPLGTAI